MNLFYVSSQRTFDQKNSKKKLFIHVEQQTRTERKDDRKKKPRLNTHFHILNCLFNGLSVDTGGWMSN